MTKLLSFAAVVTLGLVSIDTPAAACGGCFIPTEQVSVVNAHRMVFSISKDQTILWDQIKYSGEPKDFAWVLPVHATGLKVELAHDEFISALEAWSAPVITGPNPRGGPSFGCGGAASFASPEDQGGVQVLNQEIVGPYEVATLRSTDPKALDTWLSTHGYTIPESVKPTVAAYVGEGFDFIALRLQPGKGVDAMQPIRVITPGAGGTLPLRMVAAGVGSEVSILLYVISEGRYEAANYFNTEVDFSKLRWNKDQAKSNYNELIDEAMTRGDGRNWAIEYSGPLGARTTRPGFFGGGGDFASTYGSGIYSGEKCSYTNLGGPDFGDAGQAPPVDGSAEAGDGGTPDGGAVPPSYDKCYFDDLTVATRGMNPADIKVTRLRANLKVAALSQDLVLKAAADQSVYTNQHSVDDVGDGCATSSSLPDKSVFIVWGPAIAAMIVRRRRRR